MTKQKYDGGTILADAPKGESSVPSNESEKGLMIESVSIKNFRCFKDVQAEDLGLINVVVGDNASGKTTFLEALFLTATNSPQAHVKFLIWRGRMGPQVGYSIDTLDSGAFWADLFHRYELDQPVSISVKGKPSKEVVIEWYQEVDTISQAGTEAIAPVRFGWSYDGGDFEYSIPVYTDKNITMPRAGRAINGSMITVSVSPSELAQRYSDLDVAKRSQEVFSIVNAEFPAIVGLSSQPDASVGNLLYAEVDGLEKKIPLANVSGGIHRLVYILCNIAHFKGGSVYVDEFDAGIHHVHLGAVWSAILHLAKEQDTQVFLSTHSAETLSALTPIIAKNETEFRLIRVSRDWEEACSIVKVFGGKELLSALESGFELR